MTDLIEQLRRFAEKNRFVRQKGPLSVALVVTEPGFAKSAQDSIYLRTACTKHLSRNCRAGGLL